MAGMGKNQQAFTELGDQIVAAINQRLDEIVQLLERDKNEMAAERAELSTLVGAMLARLDSLEFGVKRAPRTERKTGAPGLRGPQTPPSQRRRPLRQDRELAAFLPVGVDPRRKVSRTVPHRGDEGRARSGRQGREDARPEAPRGREQLCVEKSPDHAGEAGHPENFRELEGRPHEAVP